MLPPLNNLRHIIIAMRSVQIKGYGNNEVIEIIRNAPVPSDPSAADKVLVKIKAAGVNPADWKMREGYFQEMIPIQFPSTLGFDFSGVVEKIGGSSVSLKQGDEVYGQAGIINGSSGAFAEMALANVDGVVHKPKSLNHQEAAGLPTVGVSAWQGLVENIGLSKGQKILIHGGAGGIGSIAIPPAKHNGAYVSTTVNVNDKQFVQELGAEQIIDYKSQKFEDLLHDYDTVFDTIGGDTYKRSFKVLKKGGIIISTLEQPNSELMQQ